MGSAVPCSQELTLIVIGIDLLSQSLLPAIVELAEDKQWRVRQAIIEYIPLLAKQLGVAFFDEQLGNLCMSWLGDNVYSIRESATVNLRKLTDVFGVDWARQTIVPKVLQMGTHPNYLYRMTTIFAITVSAMRVPIRSGDANTGSLGRFKSLAPSLTPPVIQENVLATVLSLVQDPIPNIRFNVAKCLEVLAISLATTAEGKELATARIVPALKQLKSDGDPDVRFFSGKALEKISGELLQSTLMIGTV